MPKYRSLDARLPTLYLDYDGVLHPENVHRNTKTGRITLACQEMPHAKLFMWAPDLLAEVSNRPLQIVLSTSWVPTLGFDRAQNYLPEELHSIIAGATYHRRRFTKDEWFQMHRYQQIAQHAHRHGITEWMALDDDTNGWPPTMWHRIIPCDAVHGFSQQKHLLRNWLQRVAPLPTLDWTP